MSTSDNTIDLETLNAETDGEYVIHNINKSIHPVHVMFRKLVTQYAQDLSCDASTAALNLMKELKKEFPRTILVKRMKVDGLYRFKKYHRMDAISKITHVIGTKRFNNRKRRHVTATTSANSVEVVQNPNKATNTFQLQKKKRESDSSVPREQDCSDDELHIQTTFSEESQEQQLKHPQSTVSIVTNKSQSISPSPSGITPTSTLAAFDQIESNNDTANSSTKDKTNESRLLETS